MLRTWRGNEVSRRNLNVTQNEESKKREEIGSCEKKNEATKKPYATDGDA
jgi:hypothetical protein